MVIRPAVVLAAVAILVCGIAYPVAVVLAGQAAFPFQANGSQFQLNGTVAGSYLIAQNFTPASFFHPWNGSASGVDPAITVGYAYSQIPGISGATGIPQSELYGIVNGSAQYTMFFFGERYINVVQVNLYLMRSYPSVYARYARTK